MAEGPKRAPTLRDVAIQAGVHAATASRALNPETRGLVSRDTARRVLRAAESLGYQANPIARSLKTARTYSIGLVIPDLTNPLFPPIVRGVEDVLTGAGYSLLIVNTDNDPDRERSLIASLRSRQVEGLIVATARLDHPLLAELRQQGEKIVQVNRRAANVDLPFVTPDDAAGVTSAVEHLVGLGHRRILHLAGPRTTSTGVARARAYQAALAAHGLPEHVVECAKWTESSGAQALRAAFESEVDFTAVVAGNDLIALGCYDVLRERGLSCPADVSVVGFNNMPYVDKLHPPLTTVAVPHHDIGEEAARMLLEVIGDPDRLIRSVLLPPRLVVRESTGAPVRVPGSQ